MCFSTPPDPDRADNGVLKHALRGFPMSWSSFVSWLPKFVNPLTALIAAAIVIPALLVLYFLKLRRREFDVPSTLLWRKAIQDLQVNAPFQKLRRNLLLLLQLLLLAFLLLALSRPVSNYTPGPGKTTVILIDRSASMSARDGENGKTRLEEAKRRAKDLVALMTRNSQAMVIAFDSQAETVQPFTTDPTLLNRAIDSIRPTDRPTKIADAYRAAEAQVNFNPEQLRPNTDPPDVRLFSDGRVLDDGPDLRIKGDVKYEKIGTDTAGNIAVVALSAKRNYERPTQVQVFARLANFGPEPVDAPVRLSVNGEAVDSGGGDVQSTFLLPERWDNPTRKAWEEANRKQQRDGVEFKLDLAQAAVIKLEQLHKDGDLLAADDVAQVVVPPPKALSVLLVADSNYFLERAVMALGLKAPDIIRPPTYEAKIVEKPDEIAKYDVIIFDNYKPPLDEKTGRPRMPPAGNFVWFNKVPEGIKTKVAMTGGTTQPSGDVKGGRPVLLTDVGVMDWDRDHPILKDLNIQKMFATQALKLTVPADQTTLVEGLKGPLMVLDREPKQTHLIIAFNSMDSHWPLESTFPVFLYNAMQFLALGGEMAMWESVQPGATPNLPRPNLLQAGGPGLRRVTLHLPDGSTKDVPIPADDKADVTLPPLDRVGLYTTEPPIPQREQIAVNLLDANESNLLPNPKPPGEIGQTVEHGGAKRPLEWWWWLAALALVMLFVEWWVYTRRVHL